MSFQFERTNPHAERTRVLLELKRYADAEKEVIKALALEPNASYLHAWLAACLLHRGATHEAEAAVQRAIHADPDNDAAYHTAAQISIQFNREAEALERIREALRLAPLTPDHHYLLGAIHINCGRFSDALHAANDGLRSRPNDVNCANLRCLCLRQLGRAAEAVETADRALAEDPEYYWSHENRASLALAAGDVERAFAHYREALRLNPLSEQARSGLAQTLKSRHRIYRLIFWLFEGTGGGTWKRLLIGLLAVAVLAYALRRPIRHIVGQVVLAFAGVAYLYFILGWLSRMYVGPFFILLLRFDRLGKRVLTRGEVLRAGMIIGSLVVGVGLLVAAVIFRMPVLAGVAVIVFALPWPIQLVLMLRPGAPRQWAVAIMAGLATAAIVLFRTAPKIPKYGLGAAIFSVLVISYFVVCSREQPAKSTQD